MERFWTLKYLQQNDITEITAVVFKENMARAEDLPLVLPILGASGLPRGARLRVKLGAVDELTLDVTGTLLARLDGVSEVQSTGSDNVGTEADDDESAIAGPIAIAVDVSENDAQTVLSVCVDAAP
jgi:exoribonuclease-2